MRLAHNYWIYSVALAVVWAVVLVLSAAIGGEARLHKVLLVFAGFVIGWISTTIARYVYEPPRKWRQ